jgi:hypothetical protein
MAQATDKIRKEAEDIVLDNINGHANAAFIETMSLQDIEDTIRHAEDCIRAYHC